MAALYKLVRKLCARYGIPTSRIYRHGEVRPESTDCPGRYFPFSQFVAGLRKSS
jgi:N-acetyl-anhydromuramyl-L-alanine amidase AmpD